jgi:2-phosphosulfolactate phosphatase
VYTPALFHLYEKQAGVVVVTDIFRATTAICAAFDHGVERIIPVAKVEDARVYKRERVSDCRGAGWSHP